jgi:hypothetical protein
MSVKPAHNHMVRGVNLENIRNTLELRVVALMEPVLLRHPDYEPSSYDIQDIYALALNSLPARYVQSGSIELSGKVPDADLLQAVEQAMARVRARPTFPDKK